MANTKISALNAITGANAATNDLIPIVDVSASETKSITRAELFTSPPAIGATTPAAGSFTALSASGVVRVGDIAPSADDSSVLSSRAATNPLSNGGSHAFRDEGTYNITSGTAGYASFDSITTASGSVEFNHIAGFQARQIYSGSETLLAGQGFVSYPTISGPTTNVHHFVAYDALGASAITNQYGLYIYPLTRASNNYGVYSAGTMQSYFGGDVVCNQMLQCLTLLIDPYLITGADGLYSSTAGTWQVKAESAVGGGAKPMKLSSGNGTTKTGGSIALAVDGVTVASLTSTGLEVTGRVSATTTIKTGGYTVATLPAGAVGDRAYVTDATTPTYNGALTGGGAVVVPVFYNGAAWVSA